MLTESGDVLKKMFHKMGVNTVPGQFDRASVNSIKDIYFVMGPQTLRSVIDLLKLWDNTKDISQCIVIADMVSMLTECKAAQKLIKKGKGHYSQHAVCRYATGSMANNSATLNLLTSFPFESTLCACGQPHSKEGSRPRAFEKIMTVLMPKFPTHQNQLNYISSSSLCLRGPGVDGSHGGEVAPDRSLNHTDSFTSLRHVDSRQTDVKGVPDCNGTGRVEGCCR